MRTREPELRRDSIRERDTAPVPGGSMLERNAARLRAHTPAGPARDALRSVLELSDMLVPGSGGVIEPCDADTRPWLARLLWRREGWSAMVFVDARGQTDWVALGQFFARGPRAVIRCLHGERSVGVVERPPHH